MKTLPIIGVSGNARVDHHGEYPGVEKAYVFNDFVASIALAGGAPFILPVFTDDSIIENYVHTIDALVLTGGQDIHPSAYGETPCDAVKDVSLKRDTFDFKLLRCALKAGKPILGICRGMQLMNVCFGGTLHQDLSLLSEACHRYNEKCARGEASHVMNVVKPSLMYTIFEKDRVAINSFHHQAIKDVASRFRVTGSTEDGIVEAIEDTESGPFLVGVQWHPEMMVYDHPKMLRLFEYFVQEARTHAQR